jgi:hypothetical protein
MTRAPPTDRDYYSLIARAISGLENSTCDTRRALYERARTAQTAHLGSIDAALSEAEIARERDALDKAIHAVELDAAATDTEQAQTDAKIVLDYATFIAEAERRLDCFYDVSALPHPKEAIISAFERQIVQSPLEEHVGWLRSGASLLFIFLEGIGPDPLPFKELDTSFMASAEIKSKEIDERIAAAMRIRAALSGE